MSEPTAAERAAWGKGGGPRFPYDEVMNPDGYMTEEREVPSVKSNTEPVREAKSTRYRITIERVVEVEAYGPREAVKEARRKYSVDIHSRIQRVEELIPQPDLIKVVINSDWEEKPQAQR